MASQAPLILADGEAVASATQPPPAAPLLPAALPPSATQSPPAALPPSATQSPPATMSHPAAQPLPPAPRVQVTLPLSVVRPLTVGSVSPPGSPISFLEEDFDPLELLVLLNSSPKFPRESPRTPAQVTELSQQFRGMSTASRSSEERSPPKPSVSYTEKDLVALFLRDLDIFHRVVKAVEGASRPVTGKPPQAPPRKGRGKRKRPCQETEVSKPQPKPASYANVVSGKAKNAKKPLPPKEAEVPPAKRPKLEASVKPKPAASGIGSFSEWFCWNCKGRGHRFSQCPTPIVEDFCKGCGRKGKTLRTCIACSPSWQTCGPYVAQAGTNVPWDVLKRMRKASKPKPRPSEKAKVATPKASQPKAGPSKPPKKKAAKKEVSLDRVSQLVEP
ncbi:uncharacterized protein [Prorops nasuta]|uniref:uncharacterized protein n=1 Tax=Prorops nasuta TaxID=863751 RepID=UPI0034CE0A9B